MAAVTPQGDSARDRAISRVLTTFADLPSSARITLVRSGDRPSVFAGPAALSAEARPALDAWRPEAPHHSLALGLRLARELAGTTGELMVLSDLTPGARAEGPFEGGLWVSVGAPLPNVGITAAERTISPSEDRGTVSLTLANHADSAARQRVSVSTGGKEVLTRDVEVPPGVSSLTFSLPPGLPTVRVGLSDDALARDNGVTLAEPHPRIVRVENHLPDGRGRQALIKALGAVSGLTHSTNADLAFAVAGELDRPWTPGQWRVGFGRPPSAWLATGDARDFIGPFVLEKRHPLLVGMTLGGVVWPGAAPLIAGAVHPLVSAGDQALAGIREAPAGAAKERAILFNLDLERTNLIRAPDWPILVSNLIELRRQSLPGPERWNYRIGEWVRVHLARDPTGPLRVRCGPVERTLPASRQLEFPAPSPGGLLQILEGEQVLFELGVNFLDEAESNLRHQTTADAGALTETAGRRFESGPPSDPLFWILLAMAALALTANWAVLSQHPQRA
jgi:hypothetical protein